MKLIKYLLSLSLLGIAGCSVNPAIKTPYSSYFIDNNELLYFIKPLLLTTNNNSTASIDFTLKDSNLKSDTGVICNFTLINYRYNGKEQFYLLTVSTENKLLNPRTVFREMNKKNEEETRFTSRLSSIFLLDALHNNQLRLIIRKDNSPDLVYSLTNKSDKKWNRLSKNLYPTLQLKITPSN